MYKPSEPTYKPSEPSRPAQNKTGPSIYEMAAMQATADSVPNNIPSNVDVYDDGERVPCSTCGRTFNPDALDRHEKICKKVFVQKRKQFNAKEQRQADGLDEI